MKKTFWKDSLRGLGKSKGRFFAIIGIVALGAGFFGGIKATSIDMKLTADHYYKQTHLNDLRVVSTLGVTEADADALRSVEGVAAAVPSYRTDAIVSSSEDSGDTAMASDRVVRFHALSAGEAELNTPKLLEGRLPTAPNEAAVIRSKSFSEGYRIGDTFRIDLAQDPDMADTLAAQEFTIVGVVDSPLYMSIESGSTSKGSGSVNTYAFLPESAFTLEAYTELYIQMEGSGELFCFAPEYEDAVAALSRRLEDIGPERCAARKAEIVGEATEKLDEAKAEYADKKAEAEEKLADAQRQIDEAQADIDQGERDLADARKKLADGERELADKQKEYEDTVADTERELADAWAELAEKEQELADAKQTLDDAKSKLDSGESAYDAGYSEYQSGESQYAAGKQQLDAAQAGLLGQRQTLQAQLDGVNAALQNPALSDAERTQLQAQAAGLSAALQQIEGGLAALEPEKQKLAAVRAQLDSAASELRGAERELSEGRREYQKGLAEYEDGAHQLSEAKLTLQINEVDFENAKLDAERQIADAKQKLADGRREIADGGQTIADGKQELADARDEYAEKKAEAEEKLADAERQIEDAEQEIADIEDPDWYVFDRSESTGYAGFAQDADRIDAIAAVFPVFFFLVAALVCLTTMTRMVEEERTQVGVMKALGYRKRQIAAKYIFYAAATSLIGSAIGLAVGFQVFPRAIWSAYGIMYTTPAIETPFNWTYAILATVVFLACTIGSTFAACWSELAAVPAELIRPKPPKSGKRIFLENIGFLWKRLSFTKKLTARNILRYKKRFFMTVIGIAGCTALMLTGFGLKDSINGIVVNQFVHLSHYDMQLTFAHEIDPAAPTARQREALELVASDERVTESLLVHQQSMTAHSAKSANTLDAYLLVPEDPSRVADFFTYRERRGKQAIPFPEEGAILTEKLASELGLPVGASIELEDSDHKRVSVKVAGVCENYVYNYVYLSPGQYRALYGKDCTYQGMLAQLGGEGGEFENALSNDLLTQDEIIGVSFISVIMDNFDDVFDRLDLVVLVLIISASLLAFVVLYNLTNINVNERIREIATIKVLGFYDREVDSYIYRENMVLTAIGILAGCVLGVFLHQYVMKVAEVNIVMFGREIEPLSYVWASLLTLAFAGVVNFVMHFRLKRVSMVESLKSIE